MSKVSLIQAIDIAERYLNESIRTEHNSVLGDRWIVSKEKIVDCGGHWMLHYQSSKYLSTGNPIYLLAGNLPLKVSKTGEVLGFDRADEKASR